MDRVSSNIIINDFNKEKEKQMDKQSELQKIKEAKKNGQIYISPLIFGDNAIVLQKILTETIKKRKSKWNILK